MKNIMIKSAIATAVVAATTATAVADVSVYGRLRMGVICNDKPASPAGDPVFAVNPDTGVIENTAAAAAASDNCGVESRSSRYGIKASSEVREGLTAFGKYEFGADIHNGGNADSKRLAYVGLKGGFGEVSIGTRWSPMYSHTVSPIDWPNAFGGTSQAGATGYQSNFRNSDTINYKNKFGAAKVGVQLVMDDKSDETIDRTEIGASFKAGSVNVGLGYADDKAADDSIAAIMVNKQFGPVFLGGTYSTSDAKDSLMLAANYGMGGGKSINLTYGQDDVDGSNATPTSIGLEYVHSMGGGFKWFAGYVTNDSDVAGADSSDQYGAGVRYDF